MMKIVAGFLLIATPALAGQTAPALGAHKNPYGQLFQAQELLQKTLTKPEAKPKPKVVCGMTIIPGDPTIDPKIAAPRDPKDTTHYTLRVVPPPICKP